MTASVPSAVRRAAARVPPRLAELAQVGATEEGGVTRLPFTASETAAVALFMDWAGEAGATVVRDPFGNVFALKGDWDRSPGIMVGSHLDTVVNGGAYDGALGVVGGLAVLEAWQSETPICAAAFRAEEATQAGRGRVGSDVLTGALSHDEALGLFGPDASDPLVDLDLPVRELALPRLYLELHVEQAETLERSGRLIGAVSGITGYARWRATLAGRADHVGTAAMGTRRDALAAAAEVVLEVERLGRDRLDVASVGLLEVEPNRVGVVPAHARLTADLRCWEDADVDAAIGELEASVAARCEHRGIGMSAELVKRNPTLRFAAEVTAAIGAAAEAIGEPALELPSGANHDAGALAAVCPAGMVFVPSRAGRSHSPDELTGDAECEAGAVVLALTANLLDEQTASA